MSNKLSLRDLLIFAYFSLIIPQIKLYLQTFWGPAVISFLSSPHLSVYFALRSTSTGCARRHRPSSGSRTCCSLWRARWRRRAWPISSPTTSTSPAGRRPRYGKHKHPDLDHLKNTHTHSERPCYEAQILVLTEDKQICLWSNGLFSLPGGSLPSSPRGRKRPDHRPQTEDSLWEAQLGQRVHQYRIKASRVSPFAVTLPHAHDQTHTPLTATGHSGWEEKVSWCCVAKTDATDTVKTF